MIFRNGLKGGHASKKDPSQCVVWLNQLANYTCQVALLPSKSVGSMFTRICLSFGNARYLQLAFLQRSSWPQSWILLHLVLPNASKEGRTVEDGFHAIAVSHPFCFPYKEPHYINWGWGSNRLLFHNFKSMDACFSCPHFLRPIGSLKSVMLFANNVVLLLMFFLCLPYPISTPVTFWVLENLILMLDKSLRISVRCQKGH